MRKLLLACGLVVCACDGGGDSQPATGDSGFCAAAPVVTYETFGSGFMTQNCQTCHASTSPDRNDAPEEVTFDTVEDCWTWSERILARAAGEAPTMPPMGGTTADDRYKLEVWLTCAEPGT